MIDKLLVVGFDPGGSGVFGWCVAQAKPWRVIKTGVENYADAALFSVQGVLNGTTLAAAGIDAPLYWSRRGDSRAADEYVRKQGGQAGMTSTSGTVQAVNSLRGACIAQGIMLAERIASEYPKCMITETHPKALDKCAPLAHQIREKCEGNEHKKDAALSAWVAAQAMSGGWQNLFLREKSEDIYTFSFLKQPVYWWPKEK